MVAGRRVNEVNLFGQRFHACVAVTYVGLGLLLGNAVRRWIPGGADWLPLVGMLLLLGGGAWWLLLWRRSRDPV
jgi:ABC-type nickel/cobalt efflux system permease component RcnA